MDIVSRFEEIVTRYPDRPAIILGNSAITFEQLRVRAIRISRHLDTLGVKQRNRCIISSPNSLDAAGAILGTWYTGAIPVLVNDLSPFEHLIHAATVTEASLILQLDPSHQSVASAIQDIAVYPLNELACEATTSHVHETAFFKSYRYATSSQEIASVVFTSGSSGMPKGVAQTHLSLVCSCESVNFHLGITADDIVFCSVPWSFDYGYGQLLSTIVCGVTQIIPEKANAFSMCEAIENNQPSVFAGLPSVFGTLCNGLSPIEKVDTQTIRLVTNTGAKLHADLLKTVKDTFSSADISLNYGLTETYRSASLPVHLVDTHAESVGFAVPGVDLVVLRPDNTVASPGESGSIVHRGLGAFQGYWNEIDKTNAVLKNDPFWKISPLQSMKSVYTGDIGYKDENGFLYLQGRADRQIKTMGVRVSPEEIEAIVSRYTHVKDVAITAQAHETYGSLVQLSFVVVDKETFCLRELKKYCRDNMSPYMLPREFHELDALPRTSSGKTNYVELTQMLSGYSQE